MATTLMTPGVYIEELNAFPGSVVAVETAVPVFIGYTEKAERNGKSLVGKPFRITSFAEYQLYFGGAFSPVFTLSDMPPANTQPAGTLQFTVTDIGDTSATLSWTPEADDTKYDVDHKVASAGDDTRIKAIDNGNPAGKSVKLSGLTAGTEYEARIVKNGETSFTVVKFTTAKTPPVTVAKNAVTLKINGSDKVLQLKANNTAYFYNSIRLFYANGGGNCYINSLGTYGKTPGGSLQIQSSDINDTLFDTLKKEYEPTLVVIPDMIADAQCYTNVYTAVLKHCEETQSRFGIFDLFQQNATDSTDDVAEAFRTDIGTTALKYGAAYYPWLKTTIVQESEVDFQNIDDPFNATTGISTLLDTDKEKDAINVLAKTIKTAKEKKLTAAQKALTGDALTTALNAISFSADDLSKNDKLHLHQSLRASSPTYVYIMQEIVERMNELPPCGAIAGIYSLIDSSRGVWKAPANVSVSNVTAPSVNISADEQKTLNVDVMAGKSINVIRPFPGIGTLIWGARTLDGNSDDWKYINVRRTIIMIEQSIKLAVRAYVFEPNDNSTWITVKSMINNFLNNLWKQGALAGAKPEQAYDVQIGLGATMTPVDILDGVMKITVKLAIVHPAEFIVITFQQQQQQS